MSEVIHLRPDEAAWLPVAEAVLAGTIKQMDSAYKESMMIGLRSIPHPRCKEAYARLAGPPKPKKEK